MQRVALYARVSTKQHGQDTETQLIQLRDYVQQRKLESIGEFVDHGWSGAKERRPQLDRLMQAARQKKFDAVLVWRFDRFARSVRHLVTALEEFQTLHIDFVSMSEQIDTSTPMGKMVFTVMGAVGELARSIIRENVRIGLDRAKREGKTLGRPRAIVDEEQIYEAVVIQKQSVKSIARTHAIARGTVTSIVRRVGARKAQNQDAKTVLLNEK
jgi:DNA invertase Pin-like site-specific DNA recombinase